MANDKKPALVRAAEIRAHEESDGHPWNPKSEVRGTCMAPLAGLSRTGVNLYRIAPGKESFLYHAHYYEEEWIYVLSGRAVAEIDGVEYEVGAGDFMGFAADGKRAIGHHLRNPFAEELVYLCGGEHRDYDVAEFPRQGWRVVRRGGDVEMYPVAAAKKPFPPL